MTDHLANTKIRLLTLLSGEFKKIVAKYIVFKYQLDDEEKELTTRRSSTKIAIRSAIFITSDDSVYGFGHNPNGQLGLGHNGVLPNPIIITELSQQKIQEVFIGGHFVLATTLDHRLFVWGDNYHGRISDVNDRYLRPIVIELLTGKAIKVIACGDTHAMVVLEDNRIFVCGKNRETPISCAEQVYCLEGLSIKKVVSRVYEKTVLLSTNGKVYRLTAYGEEYHELKATLHLNVIDICAANDKEFCLLTNDGKIYLTCGEELEEVESKEKFTSLYRYGNNWPTLAVNKEFVFEVIDKIVSKTKYKTFEEYFLYKWQLTLQMVEIPGRELLKKIPIGLGSYGQVFRVVNGEEVFALKEVKVKDMYKDIKDENSELNIMKRIDSKFVARLFDFEVTNRVLCLKMELCDCHLAEMLNDKDCANILTPLQDFVFSMEVFKELLECVQYLHSLQLKIIHRDIKPTNVLVKYHDNNGHFLKLCDFGLSKIIFRESQTNSSGVGTQTYRAPEVCSSTYNEKVDIFSLGVVMLDIFKMLNKNYNDENPFNVVDSAIIVTQSQARSFVRQLSSSFNDNASLRKRPKTNEELQVIDISSDSSDEGIDTQSTQQSLPNSGQTGSVESDLLKTKLNQLEALRLSMVHGDPESRPCCDSIIKQIGDLSLVDNFRIDNLPGDNKFIFLKFLDKYK